MNEPTEQCTRVHVRPAPGRAIPMPERGHALLPDAGQEVSRNAYWSRRIADGDVTLTSLETPAAAAADPTTHQPKGAKTK